MFSFIICVFFAVELCLERKGKQARKKEGGGGGLYLARRRWRITSSGWRREDSSNVAEGDGGERKGELGKKEKGQKHEFIFSFY
jgi:hypothetical protein